MQYQTEPNDVKFTMADFHYLVTNAATYFQFQKMRKKKHDVQLVEDWLTSFPQSAAEIHGFEERAVSSVMI